MNVCIYQPHLHDQNLTQVWIQSIPPPKLIAKPRLIDRLSYYLLLAEGKYLESYIPLDIGATWNAISLIGDLNPVRCVHF